MFFDERRIGRGLERSAPAMWHYETYEMRLPARRHLLMAQVWSLGEFAPLAQMSVAPGWLVEAEERWHSQPSTGVAAWDAKRLNGYSFARTSLALGANYGWGAESTLDGAAADREPHKGRRA